MRVLSCVALAPFFCLAQVPAPVISFDETHHDFGKMSDDGQPVSHRFKVTNKGSAPLQINEIMISCGCTHAVVGKWQIAPGEETFVEVHFDPVGLSGNLHKSLSVISNDPAKAVATLTFEANVMREIMPSSTVVWFNEISRSGSVMSEAIHLQSGNGRPIYVTDTKIPDAPYLSCTPQRDGNDIILNISIDGRLIPKEKQRGEDKLAVLTASQKMPTLQFEIVWRVQTVIAATPKEITWFNPAGKELRATVQLSHVKGRPFTVLDAKSSSPLITVSGLTEDSAAGHKLEVAMSAKAKAGAYRELLTLKMDDPEQQTVEIAIIAILQ